MQFLFSYLCFPLFLFSLVWASPLFPFLFLCLFLFILFLPSFLFFISLSGSFFFFLFGLLLGSRCCFYFSVCCLLLPKNTKNKKPSVKNWSKLALKTGPSMLRNKIGPVFNAKYVFFVFFEKSSSFGKAKIGPVFNSTANK